MIPQFLRDRYTLVVARYLARWPERTIPELPEDDPNKAVMVIDEMLAPLQNREPLKITVGDPVIFPDTTPDFPEHPASHKNRNK